jgi:hypothetical protein
VSANELALHCTRWWRVRKPPPPRVFVLDFSQPGWIR